MQRLLFALVTGCESYEGLLILEDQFNDHGELFAAYLATNLIMRIPIPLKKSVVSFSFSPSIWKTTRRLDTETCDRLFYQHCEHGPLSLL